MNFAWETAYGIGGALLLLLLIYGVYASRRRSRVNDRVTDAAVRAERRDPEGYDPKPFRDQLKP